MTPNDESTHKRNDSEVVIAVVELATNVASLCSGYLGSKELSREIWALVGKLESLKTVLLSLQDFSKVSPDHTEFGVLCGTGGSLSTLCLELVELELELEPKERVKGKLKNLIWPLEEEKTLQHIAQIEKHKSLITLTLTMNTPQNVTEGGRLLNPQVRLDWKKSFKARVYTQAEREVQRSRFKELYIDGGLALSEARRIMAEEHGFYAKCIAQSKPPQLPYLIQDYGFI